MAYENAKLWLDIAQFVFTGVVWLYAWQVARQRVTAERIYRLEAEMDRYLNDHQMRLVRSEEQLRHVAGHEDLDGIRADLGGLRADVAGVQAELKGVRQSVDRVNDYLLNRT